MTGRGGRIIVAGVGNVFLGDDGFGVEVVRQLTGRPLPAGVEVIDVGIRGVHLAYDLLDGCALLIVVDAAPRGEPPGTVSVIEVTTGDAAAADPGAAGVRPPLDPHGMAPHEVFGLLTRLGGSPTRTLVVGCEPADLTPGMDLSEPVRAAVPRAVRFVESILARETGAGPPAGASVKSTEGRCGDAVQARHRGGNGGTSGGGGPLHSGHQAVPGDPGDVMHEIGLCEGILDTVRRRARGREVRRVRVRAGVRHAIDDESMAQAFTLVAQGTEAADASIELITVPARLNCRACGAVSETVDLLALCPACGGDAIDIDGGEELTLESIEYAPSPSPSSASSPAG